MSLSGNIVSNTKISIDFGGGAFQLGRVNTSDETSDQDAEVIIAMGVPGGAGYRFKNGGGAFSFEIYREEGLPEVDWVKLQTDRTRITLVLADDAGRREMYTACVVANVARKDDAQGSHMNTVKVLYLKRFKL